MEFSFAGLLVGFGQFFFDLTSWQRLFMIEMNKVRLTFSLSGLIWIIFPLSFSSLFIMVIFTGGFTDIHSILAGLANKITTPFFFILFVLCAFSAITSTFGACLHSLVSLIVANILEPLQTKKATSKNKDGLPAFDLYWRIGFRCYTLYSPNLLELLFYSGNIYSALLAPILVIVFSKGKVADYIPISAVLAIVASYIIQPHVSEFQSIWFSGLASLTILVICTILTSSRTNGGS